MKTPKSGELKAFVPSKDFEQSKQFYKDLGFVMNWEGERVAQFKVGDYQFLLQDHYVKDHADNFMLFLFVDDVDEWWEHIKEARVAEKYNVKLKPPQDYPWGMREIHMLDPTGVLWHFGKNIENDNQHGIDIGLSAKTRVASELQRYVYREIKGINQIKGLDK